MKDGWPVPARFKAQEHARRQQAKKEIEEVLYQDAVYESGLYSAALSHLDYRLVFDEIDDNCYCETCQTYGYCE